MGFFLKFEDYDLAKKYDVIKGEYYSKEIVNQAKQNPVFLHFGGSEIPGLFKDPPYRKVYVEYCEEAGFGEELITNTEGFLVLKFLFKSVHNFFY